MPISVIIPTYNRAALVPRAVQSALAAMGPEDELIVIDDGSTDETEKAVAPYQEQIRYLHTPHGGPGAARNRGIREARHPLIALLDSDDEWTLDKLALQRALLQARPDVVYCFSDFVHRDRLGVLYHNYIAQWHHDPRSWDEILGPGILFSAFAALPRGREDFCVHIGDLYPSALLADYVFTSTVVVRRALAGDALFFPQESVFLEDQHCFARLARRSPVAYLACETAWNHAHRGPRWTDGDTLRRATARLTLLESVWGTDQEFLARHEGDFRQIVARQRLLKARGLLSLGRTEEAREELRYAGSRSLLLWLLSCLPGVVTREMIRVGRMLCRDKSETTITPRESRPKLRRKMAYASSR